MRRHLSLGAAVALVLACAVVTRADSVTLEQVGGLVSYMGDQLSNETINVTASEPAGPFPASSFFDVFVDITITPPIGPSTNASGDAMLPVIVSPPTSPGDYPIQIIQTDIPLSGGGDVRIDGTSGTMVTEGTGPTFRIDSFFDIFTELSLDNGANFSPQIQADPAPLPTTLVTGLALLGLGAVLFRHRLHRRRPRKR